MEAPRVRKLLRDLLSVGLARAAATGIVALRNAALAAWLGPGDFGVWSSFQLVIRYADNSHFGFRHALNRDYPIAQGRGDDAEARDIERVTFAWISALGLATGLGILVAGLGFFGNNQTFSGGLAVVSFVVVIRQLGSYFLTQLRVRKDFARVSVILVVLELLIVACIAAFLPTLGILGGLAALGIPYVAVVAYLWRRHPPSLGDVVPTLLRETRRAKYLFAVGFPILVFGYLSLILLTLDRWVVLWLLETTDFGIYSFAALFVAFFGMISSVMGYVMLPSIGEEFGAGRAEALRKILVNSSYLAVFMAAPLSALGAAVLPLVVVALFPDYLSAVLVAQLLLGAAVFSIVSSVAGQFLIVSGKYKAIGAIQTGMILLKFGLVYLAVQSGYGLLGAAAASVIAFSAYGLTVLGYALVNADLGAPAVARQLLRCLFPWLMNFAVLGVGVWTLRSPGWYEPTLSGTVVPTIVLMAALVVVNAPLFFYVNRRMSLVQRCVESFSRRVKA